MGPFRTICKRYSKIVLEVGQKSFSMIKILIHVVAYYHQYSQREGTNAFSSPCRACLTDFGLGGGNGPIGGGGSISA